MRPCSCLCSPVGPLVIGGTCVPGKQGGLGPGVALGIPVDLQSGLRAVPLLQPAPAAPPAAYMVSGVVLNPLCLGVRYPSRGALRAQPEGVPPCMTVFQGCAFRVNPETLNQTWHDALPVQWCVCYCAQMSSMEQALLQMGHPSAVPAAALGPPADSCALPSQVRAPPLSCRVPCNNKHSCCHWCHTHLPTPNSFP